MTTRSMNKPDKELVQSILGGEMRNAWQKETRPNQDIRPQKGIDRRPRADSYRDNYSRIFKHE